MAHTAAASIETVAAPSFKKATPSPKKAAAADRPSELAYLDQPSNVHGYWLLVMLSVVGTWVISLLIAARA